MSEDAKTEVNNLKEKPEDTESEQLNAVTEVLEDASLDQLKLIDLDGAVEADQTPDEAEDVPEKQVVITEQEATQPVTKLTASKEEKINEATSTEKLVSQVVKKSEVTQANSPKQQEAATDNKQDKKVSIGEETNGNKVNNIVAEVKPKMIDSSLNQNLNGNDDLEQDAQASRDKEIETLRGIIYGSQQREAERRFKVFDARLEAIYEEFRTSASRQQDAQAALENNYNSLEERTKQDFEALEARLQSYRRELLEKISIIERHLQEGINTLRRDLSAQVETLFFEKLNTKDIGNLLIEMGVRLRKEQTGDN
ncbi:hypothetical protein [Candidatus Chlorohelix sp.]|uniref:hypothetical protein n=1 Tax=Candidatus Chlorohelix sp. TaxID=3139201 RepID=UPI00305BB552